MQRFKHLHQPPTRFRPLTVQQGSGMSDVVNSLRNAGQAIDKAYFGSTGTKIRNLIPASDETAANQFPGERHQVLRLSNGKLGTANWSGPGTQVVKRLKRGDKPRTLTDKAAMAHDLRYTLADDDNELRVADQKMINKLKQLQETKADSNFNIRPARYIMQGKVTGENLGIFKKDTFVDTSAKLDDADRKIVQEKLTELEQEGYGHALPGQELKRRLLKQIHSGSGHCGSGVTLPGQSGGGVKKLCRFYKDLHTELQGQGLSLPGQKGSGMMEKQLTNAMKKVKHLKPKARHAAKVIAKHLGLPEKPIAPLLIGAIHKTLKGQQVGSGSMKRLAKKILKHVGPFLKEYGPTIASAAMALL